MADAQTHPADLRAAWKAHRPAAPVRSAMGRLAEMARAGTAPDRMEAEVRLVLESWRQDSSASAKQIAYRAELLHSDLYAACAALSEDAGGMDTADTTGWGPAQRTLAALRAARDELARQYGEMP